MFCSLMSVFLYFSGFESFAPLERWCDFAKFWCGKKKLVAVKTKIVPGSKIFLPFFAFLKSFSVVTQDRSIKESQTFSMDIIMLI